MATYADLIAKGPEIINIGLKSFYDDISKFTKTVNLDWQPPGWGDAECAHMIAVLSDDSALDSLGSRINAANKEALNRIKVARPVVKNIVKAGEVITGMTKKTILHAGPPIEWDKMCGPMRGAVIGALMYENLASTPKEAEELAASGEIEYAPCHSRNAVGPMAGIISYSMPVWVIHNETFDCTAFATMNEGWGRTLRFGAYDENVLTRLKWMEHTLAPVMKEALERLGGIDLKTMIAQALQMGDECHNRDIAATNLFFKLAAPIIVDSKFTLDVIKEVITFLGTHEHFFLNLAMAACKSTLMPVMNIPYSTVVTAIARNGVEVGIMVSGIGTTWFTDKVYIPQGLYFPGYSEADANPDLGDSAITETGGIGAFVMGAAPAIVQFVGGTANDAVRYTREMYEITVGINESFSIPSMSFAGAPTGIDLRKVVDTSILPIVNTGIAHREAGHGLVGAGIVRVPSGVFTKALRAFAEKYVR